MNPFDSILLPITIGLTQVAKLVGLPKRFVPLFAIVVATGLGLNLGLDWPTSILVGLASIGLYSSVKNIVE